MVYLCELPGLVLPPVVRDHDRLTTPWVGNCSVSRVQKRKSRSDLDAVLVERSNFFSYSVNPASTASTISAGQKKSANSIDTAVGEMTADINRLRQGIAKSRAKMILIPCIFVLICKIFGSGSLILHRRRSMVASNCSVMNRVRTAVIGRSFNSDRESPACLGKQLYDVFFGSQPCGGAPAYQRLCAAAWLN